MDSGIRADFDLKSQHATRDHRCVADPRRNFFAWREDAKLAGLLHWGEGEVAVIVGADDDASVYLIRSGARIKRTVRSKGEGGWSELRL
jgi:hypothetical protein